VILLTKNQLCSGEQKVKQDFSKSKAIEDKIDSLVVVKRLSA